MNRRNPRQVAARSERMLRHLRPEAITLMRERDPGLLSWLRTQAGEAPDLDDVVACARSQFAKLPASDRQRLLDRDPILFLGLAAA